MRWAWLLLVVGLTGCLALVSDDRPWACDTDADCPGGKTCQTLNGQAKACYGPGACVQAPDCWSRLGTTSAFCSSGTCACPSWMTACGGKCVDASADPSNCGACGKQCQQEQSCNGGTCQCANNGTLCADGCADLTSDPDHCGSCDIKCPAGAACESASCVCPAGQIVCPEGCVDLQSDPQDCGACGTACTITGQQCTQGTCQCPNGGSACPSGCTDIQSDAHNCGSCGTVCDGTCTAGRCIVTLYSEPTSSPAGIAIDATNVYWTVWADGTVKKLPKTGGTPTTLASGQNAPDSLAVDANNVYWGNYNGGQVTQVPIAGGTPITLASGQTRPAALAVGSQVFWWSNGDSTNNTSQLLSAPIGGGAVTTWESSRSYTWGLAVSGMTTFWTAYPYLYTESSPGAAVNTNDPGALPCAIAVQAGVIYWTNSNSADAVVSAGLDGKGYKLLATGPSTVIRQSIAVDATSVYWSNSDGTIMKVPLSGGSPILLTTVQEDASNYNIDAQRLAVDDTSVYWTNATANTIMKLTPK